MKRQDKIAISVGLICMTLALFMGITYAYWIVVKQQTGVNIIETSCFNIEFTDSNDINLKQAIPITDEEGMKQVPYTFTVKNVCNTAAAFDINLEVLNTSTMNTAYVDAVLDSSSINLISELNNRDATITGATSKNIGSGILRANQEKTYNLRLWMDEGVTLTPDSQEKKLEAKVVIVATAIMESDIEEPSTPPENEQLPEEGEYQD